MRFLVLLLVLAGSALAQPVAPKPPKSADPGELLAYGVGLALFLGFSGLAQAASGVFVALRKPTPSDACLVCPETKARIDATYQSLQTYTPEGKPEPILRHVLEGINTTNGHLATIVANGSKAPAEPGGGGGDSSA